MLYGWLEYRTNHSLRREIFAGVIGCGNGNWLGHSFGAKHPGRACHDSPSR
jgi:hypothetical protein